MRKIRELFKLLIALLLFWLYLPHIVIYLFKRGSSKYAINEDMKRYESKLSLKIPKFFLLIYLLHNNWAYRTLYYYRIGPILSFLFGWWRPKDRYFDLSATMKLGPGAYFAHPRSTGINANSIGCNFSCRQLTTIGNKRDGDNKNRPVIGDNVTLGTNVTIIGSIHIGNNVTIGAGSVVVNDVPDNCIIAGNPAEIIRRI